MALDIIDRLEEDLRYYDKQGWLDYVEDGNPLTIPTLTAVPKACDICTNKAAGSRIRIPLPSGQAVHICADRRECRQRVEKEKQTRFAALEAGIVFVEEDEEDDAD